MKPFECSVDRWGNITMAAGKVLNLRQGQSFTVADRAVESARQALPNLNGRRSFLGRGKEIFLGGSGRNITMETTGGTSCPVGYFRPTVDDEWQGTLFPGCVLSFNPGTGAAALNDGTADVATGSGMTTAPVGSLTLTSYGRTNYNGGTAATITTDWEGGAAIPGCSINPTTSGIAPDTLTATGAQTFEADTLTGWTLTISSDGSAVINDGTDDVAERAAGALPYDAAGSYTSTPAGAAAYGDDGADFTIYVQGLATVPLEGWVYVHILESAPGVISTVSGPFFAPTAPTNADPDFYVPIAYSDGAGNLEQIQEGAIQWGGGGESLPLVTISSEDFLALDPPDDDTIYDVYDAIP